MDSSGVIESFPQKEETGGGYYLNNFKLPHPLKTEVLVIND